MDTTHTKGQIEDIISKKAAKFHQEALGVGPRETRTHILEDMIIVRLKGKLLPIEEKLLEGKGGIGLVKDIRQTLHEITIQKMSSIIEKITHQKVVSTHSDISTKTGERIEIFILDQNYEDKLR